MSHKIFNAIGGAVDTSGVRYAKITGKVDVITPDGGGLYLNGSALAAAELTYIDGITAIGTAQASKAVVLDASKGIVGLGVTSVGTSNTSGVVLTASVTNALQVVAEDNGVTIASGNPKAIKGRFFVKANPGDCTIDGVLGQVKINTSITCSADYTNGIRGYLELVGGNTVNTGGANANIGAGGHGVHGWITAAGNLTIASGHYLCGVASRLSVDATFAITTTGVLAAYGVFADDNAGGASPTQAWQYGLYIPSGVATTAIRLQSGATIDATTHLDLKTSTDTYRIRLNDRNYAVTSGDIIGFSCKPAANATGTQTVYGGQISPRANDNIDIACLVGLQVEPILKGATVLAVSGDMRGIDVRLTSEGANTVGGIAGGAFFYNELPSSTYTGGVYPIVVKAAGKTQAWTGLMNIPTAITGAANGSGADVYINFTINGTAARLVAKYVA